MAYRIFIGLMETAGYYGNLKKGFREIGIECTFIDLSFHSFQYGGDDEPNIFVKACKWNLKQMSKYNHNIVKKLFLISAFIFKVFIFIWALCL